MDFVFQGVKLWRPLGEVRQTAVC